MFSPLLAGDFLKSQDSRCGQRRNTVNPAAVLTSWVSPAECDNKKRNPTLTPQWRHPATPIRPVIAPTTPHNL